MLIGDLDDIMGTHQARGFHFQARALPPEPGQAGRPDRLELAPPALAEGFTWQEVPRADADVFLTGDIFDSLAHGRKVQETVFRC